MRIIHTADWHLGRQFHNVSLIEDQAHVLEEFIELARERDVDAVIVAGDVYDRAIPPNDAVTLLDEILEKLIIENGIPVIMISGNHDSSDRLGFASGLLGDGGFHVYGPLESTGTPLVLSDKHGDVYFCPIPYADPRAVRIHTGDEEIKSHDLAVRSLVELTTTKIPKGARIIGIAHCWVTGGTSSDSERPLTIGGTGNLRVAAAQAANS